MKKILFVVLGIVLVACGGRQEEVVPVEEDTIHDEYGFPLHGYRDSIWIEGGWKER